MKDLVIDIGNTRLKAALYGPFGCSRRTAMAHGDLVGLKDWVGAEVVQRVVLGSVAAVDPDFEAGLRSIGPLIVIGGSSASPLRNAYDTPLTLGVDRLANVVGAQLLFPGRAVIVIDLGSCITYDVLDSEGVYRGGIIAPGMRMRARAMNAYSARLPLVEPMTEVPLVGRSTHESLASGVFHGIRSELRALIEDLRHEMPGAAVVLTGGDALRFARALKSGIFADPLLTLNGLHALLLHQRSLATGPASAPGLGAGDGSVRG
ncbi:MAG: type III pantothenate kinase [Flavobacteriales bacterium]|nr:type III pantothenate kinase [Flavobacteriales bacterium]